MVQPGTVVVGVFDYLQAALPGIAYALVQADVIFLPGMDVGVAVEDDGPQAVLHHALHYGPAARGAASVEQDLPAVSRYFQLCHSNLFFLDL